MRRRQFLHNGLLPGITELFPAIKPQKSIRRRRVKNLTYESFADIFEVVEKGTPDDVRYFVKQEGNDVVYTCNKDYKIPLDLAVELDKIEVVRFLISVMMTDDFWSYIDWTGGDGKTPLHRAVELGNIKIIKFLVSKWADVDMRDEEGKTPFHLAVELGKIKVVKCLVSNGADFEAKDRDGLTPLHLAVLGRYDDIINVLVSAGANICVTKELFEWSMRNDNMAVIDWFVNPLWL